jgi:uncharacterized protein (DUF1501 family)
VIGRRRLLGGLGGVSGLGALGAVGTSGLLGGLSLPGQAASDDYKALVVIFLNGGNDGHNLLVPTDAGYTDYLNARANLAIPKASLLALPGTVAGRSFGLHPNLAPLAPLYGQGRLAFISNVGPLVEPATATQVRAGSVRVPPFLLSHSDQIAIVQGWTVSDDGSGWAGRGLEALDAGLRHPLAAVAMDTRHQLVTGRATRVAYMPAELQRQWGMANLDQPDTPAARALQRLARSQSAFDYEAEFARSFGAMYLDSVRFSRLLAGAPQPTQSFGDTDIGHELRALASVLPMFRADGLRRQVIQLDWGAFDTHANQRGTAVNSQDKQLGWLGTALAAFDAAVRAAGLDQNVVTLVMTEFGRTLRPGSGGGSEHGWGNHWMALGGPVAGGTVVGRFPSLLLGGIDDADASSGGRIVPGISSDQVGATLMQWLGLPAARFVDVFPLLANFPTRTVPLLRA